MRRTPPASTAPKAAPPARAPGKRPHRLPHHEHLAGLEFLKVMAKGAKRSCSAFHFYSMPAEEFSAGVAVSRRLGGAVMRNRIKRILRESLRLTRDRLVHPCHLVLVAREGAEDLSLEQATTTLTRLYGEAKLVAGTSSTS